MMPQGGACMDPRATFSRIYKEDHYILLQTKYMKALGPVLSEKIFFFCFSHDAPWAGPVWTPGARFAGFIKRTTIHCYIQNMKALGLVVSEKKIFMFFPWRPQGRARMNPRGTVGRIYKEDHYTLLHPKYERSGPCGFREEDFFVFPIVCLWELMTQGRGHIWLQGHGLQDL